MLWSLMDMVTWMANHHKDCISPYHQFISPGALTKDWTTYSLWAAFFALANKYIRLNEYSFTNV